MYRPLPLLFPLLLLAGCAATGSQPPAAPSIYLLGEVHDNPAGHERRLSFIRSKVEAGWRPAIAMEQFDREHQQALDGAMASCKDADCVIKAASGNARWEWKLYQPVIDLALQYKLPLLAANLSRTDAAKVMRDGFAAALDQATIQSYRLDQPLPAALVSGQVQAIKDGHCNMLPDAMAPGMVRAQVARDVVMAQVVAAHAQRGAVLLAGNGHVRNDVGVPQWLPAGAAKAVSIGYTEGAAGQYDQNEVVAAHARPDQCAQLKARGG